MSEKVVKMACTACNERAKYWKGDDPTCSFQDGVFNSEGWNCATVAGIRNLCDEYNKLPPGVHFQSCEDQKYATIDVSTIEDLNAITLWVSWYKNRGRTEAMWLLCPYDPPKKPTVRECEIIVAHYKELSNKHKVE